MNHGRFRVIVGEGGQRVSRFGIVPCLIIAVEFVDILDELAV
jgi:hypothetical protein